MKIYLTDQEKRFKKHLESLKNKAVRRYEKERLTEKTATIDIETAKRIDELDLDFLFGYQIFPQNIMTSLCQWSDEHRKMAIGDTIVQQACIPPTQLFSQKIIFGVRINEMINQPDRKGFSYETLERHAEKGISTFTVEQSGNKILFKIQTYSTPGNFFTKLAGPFFSIPYQSFCTGAALRHVKRQLDAL